MEIQSIELSLIESPFQEGICSQLQQKFNSKATKKKSSNGVPDRLSTTSPKEKKVRKYIKKDQRKNMCGYSFKFVIKEFLSTKYEPFFDKLCDRWNVTNKKEVKDYYQEKRKMPIPLMNLRSYLNFN